MTRRLQITEAPTPEAARQRLARIEESRAGWQPYRPEPAELAAGKAQVREFWAARPDTAWRRTKVDAPRRRVPAYKAQDPPEPTSCSDPSMCVHWRRHPAGPWTCAYNHLNDDEDPTT